MRTRSTILATLFATFWTSLCLGQLATDLGPFALNGCLTFDKSAKVYLVRRASDFVNSVDIVPEVNHGGETSLQDPVDNSLLTLAPPSAAAEYHGRVAGRRTSGRILIRPAYGFREISSAEDSGRPLGLAISNGFALPDANALLLHSAQTQQMLDNTNRSLRSLHEHLLVGFERTPIRRHTPIISHSSAFSRQSARSTVNFKRSSATQENLDAVDHVLLDLFLEAVDTRMNAHIRELGKTPKGDLAATAYGIIKQGQKNGSLLLGEVVEFMLNDMEFPEQDILAALDDIAPEQVHIALYVAGLLDLNEKMNDEQYAALTQVVDELDFTLREGNSGNITPEAKNRLETLVAPFNPEPPPIRHFDLELHEKVRIAGRDLVRKLESLTAENGSVSREDLVDAVGKLLQETGALREGTITSLQEQVIADALRSLDELDPEAGQAVVEAFLSFDATRPTFLGQVDPCSPVCSDPRAWKHDIWFEGFGNFTNQWMSSNLQGYSGETWGLNTGVERRVGRDLVFGVGFSGAFGNLRAADRTSRGDNDSYLFTLYGAATRNDWTLSGAVGFGYADFATERFDEISRFRSSHDGNLFTGSLMLSRSFKLNWSELTPFLGFNYIRLHEDEFSETGDLDDLVFDGKSTKSFMQTVGVRFSGRQKLENGWVVNPSLSAGWLHDYGGGRLSTAANYVDAPAFVVDGVSRNQNRAVLGFSLGTQIGSRLNVFASYNGELSTNYSSQTGQVGFNIAF